MRGDVETMRRLSFAFAKYVDALERQYVLDPDGANVAPSQNLPIHVSILIRLQFG